MPRRRCRQTRPGKRHESQLDNVSPDIVLSAAGPTWLGKLVVILLFLEHIIVVLLMCFVEQLPHA